MTEDYLLGVILFAPFAGAAVLATPWVSNRHPLLVRQLAAFFAGISFFASFYLLLAFDWQKGGYQFQQKYVWSEQLGIQFYIGVDGIGVPMVLASSILLFAGVFISWHIKDRTKEFYAFLLMLAEKAHFEGKLATIIWLLCFFGFASIARLWPLHSWSPVGHAAAPAATSMLHAGVLMKLGHFSIIRVAFEILPETTRELMPIAAVLCMFNIVYGGFVAFYAKDTKYVIGYSSSSHMGYVFLGMAALDYISFTGAVMYMFAHAMATGMLFAMAGWVYDQTHSRDIPSLGGLSNRMPFISGCFVVACMASIGVPGTVNFIAEVMIIVGSWNKYPFQVIVAVVGIVLTLAYLSKMLRVLFYGPMDQKYSHAHDAVAVADRLPLLIMITVSIGFFFFPMHLYYVVRSGVDPLIAKITRVVPVASQEREALGVKREARADSSRQNLAALPGDVSSLTPYASRSDQ